MSRVLVSAFALSFAPVASLAQTSIPPNQLSNFRDTSSFKPPAGAKVAIIEYEDLECPHCAKAFPIVHAAASHYHIPVEEYDFQLPYHHWSHEGAIFAHYLKAKVSPEMAEEFRRETFANQYRIASLDDLHNWEQQFMKQHGKQVPFVVDPNGEFDREINASTSQGEKIGVNETPTILVVTPNHWIQVKDVDQMYVAIDQAEADANRGGSTVAHKTSAARK